MASSLLDSAPPFLAWNWADIEPQYAALEQRTLNEETIGSFLQDWSHLSERVDEMYARLYASTTQDTSNQEAARRYHQFLDEIFPQVEPAEQRLRRKLLESGLEPEGFEVPMRRMRVEVELFREANVPLQAQAGKLGERYLSITGARTVEWEGKTITLAQVRPVLADTDRDRRERAWRRMTGRMLQDRDEINQVWKQLLTLRRQEAENAGFSNYRDFRWQQLKRFDYTPEDAKAFHDAVEEVVVPAVARRYKRRQERLGVDVLRPWDLQVDPFGRPPLHPFTEVSELIQKSSAIFHRVDPQLGAYFDSLHESHLLDLEGRPNKAPIGYCYPLPFTGKPFIFFEAAGTRGDVETVLHEGGHAFHVFESAALPYYQQRNLIQIPMEFAEVGSMAMEFLGEPYLTTRDGGFYEPDDAARARLDHIEQRVLALWGGIAMGDAFQHWAYEHADEAMDPARLDTIWEELSRRFVPIVDWTGLEQERMTGWQNVPHFFEEPFYFIEYGLAQLGAVQIAANARENQAEAVRAYRRALALGATQPLPALFTAAGAHFAFDTETFRTAVRFLEETIDELEAVLAVA